MQKPQNVAYNSASSFSDLEKFELATKSQTPKDVSIGELNDSSSDAYHLLDKASMQNTGYVFALSYKDQLSSSAGRIASLQCWANQWNMVVVQPFVNGTYFRASLNHNMTNTKEMTDMFDVSEWNAYSKRHSLAPLAASWKDFLKSAPRDVVLVQLVYSDGGPKCLKSSLSDKECNRQRLRDFWSQMLAPHHFRISRYVCIDLRKYTYLSMYHFNALVWGDHSPNTYGSASLVIDEWAGICDSKNISLSCYINIKNTDCESKKFVQSAAYKMLTPGSQLLQDADMYIHKYFNASTFYTAVMVRWERITIYDNTEKSKSAGLQCTNQIIKYLTKIQNRWNVAETFLASDVGKYGSGSFELNYSTPSVDLFKLTEKLLQVLYGKHILFEDYNRAFEDISNSNHPAYIAQLQRVIAARARCLLLFGYGSFQHHTLQLYRTLRRDRKTHCYKIVSSC